MSEPKNYALIIGVAKYQYINSLPEAVTNDAIGIGQVLTDPAYGNYPSENITTLLDKEAHRDAIADAFMDLAERATKSASIFIFFSGHGGMLESGEHAGAYLLSADTRNTSPHEMVDTSISSKEFSLWLKRLEARQVLVVFDACHAGGIGKPKDGYSSKPVEFNNGFSDPTYKSMLMCSGNGRAIIASSRENEYSWVNEGDENSLFTKHLLNGLKGGAARNDGFVRLFHLFEYVQPLVVQEKSIQHPVFKCETEENFPIVYNAIYKKSPIPATLADGFEYDAYIGCLSSGDDSTWVEKELVPRLEQEGLRCCVLTSENPFGPSLPKVLTIDRAITRSRWVVLMMSDDYLENNAAEFVNSMAQFRGIDAGNWPVIPVYRQEIRREISLRLKMIAGLDLEDEASYERRLGTLLKTIKSQPPNI